jgi:hypothetical protein
MQNNTSLYFSAVSLVMLCVVIEQGDSGETWWTPQDG